MKGIVVYTQGVTEPGLKLLAVYLTRYSLELRFDFAPKPLTGTADEIAGFIQESPFVSAQYFTTVFETNLDEENFASVLSEKLNHALSAFGHERVISSLTVSKDF